MDFNLVLPPANGSPPEGTEVIWFIYKVSMDVNTQLPIYVTFGKLIEVNKQQ